MPITTHLPYCFKPFLKLAISAALVVVLPSLARPVPANQVFSFGDGQLGATGSGAAIYATDVPAQIDTANLSGERIEQVSAGGALSLILTSDGSVFSFGWNDDGQTGLGTSVGSTLTATPIDTSNLAGKQISQVAAGGNSLILADDGTVFSFGNANGGQIGRGGDGSIAAAVDDTHLSGKRISQIAVGANHGLLLSDEGDVYSFGSSLSGQTGLGTDDDVLIPTRIDSSYFQGKTITQVSAGFSHSLLLAEDGTVFSFGNNGEGQTGQGTTDFDTLFPTPIDNTLLGGKTIAQISAGHAHSLLLADDGTAFSFGSNSNGRTGLGNVIADVTTVATPIDDSNLQGKKLVQVSAGRYHSLVLADDGTAYSFGRNSFWGQTGLGTTTGETFVATQLDTSNLLGMSVTQLAAGGTHSLLLAVPEPTSVVLLGLGLVSACYIRRVRR